MKSPAPKVWLHQKVGNGPSQLQRNIRPRAGVHRIPPYIIPVDKEFSSIEQEGDDRVHPQLMPDDDETLSDDDGGDVRIQPQSIPDDALTLPDEKEGNRRISRQKAPDDDEIQFDNEEGDDRVRPQGTSHDDLFPSEEQEGVERITADYEIPYNAICLFEETENILPCDKRKYNVLIFVGLMSSEIDPVNCLLDTCAGLDRRRIALARGAQSHTN